MPPDTSREKILVTAALPYANGSIHLGHLVEYTQTDIYVRFLKLTGRDAIYVCADDTHGAPIEISARREGIAPETFIARFHEEHQADFAAFDVAFDVFHTTHSEENRKWAYRIYEVLKEGGHLEERSMAQLYCEKDARFLPDRFVKGTCPRCKAPDQYGDVCERCGATYEPTDLIEPFCTLCGTPPVSRESTHLFVRLADFQDFLKGWTTSGTLQPEIRNFVEGWLADGLKPWCVTRDGPYFGFEVPDRPGKFFYVWLDAPIGYISATEKWAREHGRDVGEYWNRPGARIIHVIGKDIVYFHTLFWPAMLEGAGLNLPSRVVVHGMLTVNGEKMSKTRGTFINAREYLAHLDPQWLRYYYAGNLSARPEDLDLNFDDFRNRINSELVNNIANLCHRSVSFVGSRLDGRVGRPSDRALEVEAMALLGDIRAHYEAFEFRKAIRAINELADLGNRYFQDREPWKVVKTDVEAARATVTECVNIAGLLAVALAPVVPRFSETVHQILGTTGRRWEEARFDIADREIGAARPLVDRVEPEKIEALLARGGPAEARTGPEAQPAAKTGPEAPAGAKPAAPAGAPTEAPDEVALIDYEQFAAVALKAGRILAAEKVEKADRLLKLEVDLGEAEPRTIVAGIAEAYTPEAVTGKTVVVVANLAPRKLRGIMSQGMILAAGGGGKDLKLAEVPGEVPPGTPVK
jgi:methionyl-tRNA synthetase